MNRPSSVIVVLEDSEHEMLMRRYLRKCGVGNHQMRFVKSPSGRGSAEKWVQQTFATEAGVYRARQARAETALIVILDADTHTVRDRLTQLGRALNDIGKPTVESHERIACLVPKRNVETWILSLNGQQMDETTDYKQPGDRLNELIPAAAETLHQWTRPNAAPPDNCIDSLRHGIGELKRLPL